MRKPKAKQHRTTLAKRIAHEATINRKWSVAIGQSMDNFAPESELELMRLVQKWRTYSSLARQAPEDMRDPRIVITGEKQSVIRKAMLDEFAELGFIAATAIMEGNHKFFSRLAPIVQFDKKPNSNKRYADILHFCRWSGSGTVKRPCDLKRLHAFLLKRGHKFGDAHANQIPRTVRADCKRLGLIGK